MSNYVDGFVLPIPRDRVVEYQDMVKAVAEIWKEHGALDYREYAGDDMRLEGTRSFDDLASATSEEVVIFGWVTFESREARDLANELVASDPRMELLIDVERTGFDASKMVYGGFRSIL